MAKIVKAENGGGEISNKPESQMSAAERIELYKAQGKING